MEFDLLTDWFHAKSTELHSYGKDCKFRQKGNSKGLPQQAWLVDVLSSISL